MASAAAVSAIFPAAASLCSSFVSRATGGRAPQSLHLSSASSNPGHCYRVRSVHSERSSRHGGALACSMVETPARPKTGAELREEFFLAAATGAERGLPEGAFLNDSVTEGETAEITWEPYGDTCTALVGSSLLKAAVDAGAMTIDNRFCLTGQCDVCIVEIAGGEVVRSCMKPVPEGSKKLTCLVLDTDDAWDAMVV